MTKWDILLFDCIVYELELVYLRYIALIPAKQSLFFILIYVQAYILSFILI